MSIRTKSRFRFRSPDNMIIINFADRRRFSTQRAASASGGVWKNATPYATASRMPGDAYVFQAAQQNAYRRQQARLPPCWSGREHQVFRHAPRCRSDFRQYPGTGGLSVLMFTDLVSVIEILKPI